MPEKEFEVSESEWRDASEVSIDDEGLDEDAWVPPEEKNTDDDRDEMEFFTAFDPKWRNAFEGLAYIGHLTGRVEIPYHNFVVKTLTVGEKIKVIELTQHLESSANWARAYRAAVVAAGIVEVDGRPLLMGSKRLDEIEQKYNYLLDNWHDFVIDVLFEKMESLELKVLEILKELGVHENRKYVAVVEKAETAGELEV